MEHYTNINAMVQAADLTLPPPEKEPDRQYYFIKKLQQHIAQKEQEKGRKLTCNIKTFGCQMNARDSEKILGILQTIGYEETDSEQADLVLYNTCTVRENANLKVYGRLGQLKRYKSKNPDMLTILCGCMMQEPEVIERIKKSYRNVDIIFGTHNIFKLAELLAMRLFDQDAKRMIIDIWKDTTEIVEELPNSRKYSFKGGVNIMFGCNNFCSYCIVPYVRGRERSREPEDIIEEIVGDINDEYDEQEIVYTRDKNGAYIFEASTLLNDFYKITDIEEDSFQEVEGDADTLAGLILEIKGELPHKDEVITYKEHQFKVLEVDNRRIKKIQYKKTGQVPLSPITAPPIS